MARSSRFSSDDAAALLRLHSGLHRLPVDAGDPQRYLLRELCRLTGASFALAAVCELVDGLPGRPAMPIRHVGHLQETRLETIGRYLRDRQPADPILALLPTLRARSSDGWTWTRQEVIDDDAWYGSEHVQLVRRPAGIDHCLYSFTTLPDAGLIAEIWVARPWGHRRSFTQRHKQLTALAHDFAGWIYNRDLPTSEADLHGMPPRQRETLDQLLTGQSEKEIALTLRLSTNTVHHYVKAIYRRFGVSSRGELLSRFVASAPTTTRVR